MGEAYLRRPWNRSRYHDNTLEVLQTLAMVVPKEKRLGLEHLEEGLESRVIDADRHVIFRQ